MEDKFLNTGQTQGNRVENKDLYQKMMNRS